LRFPGTIQRQEGLRPEGVFELFSLFFLGRPLARHFCPSCGGVPQAPVVLTLLLPQCFPCLKSPPRGRGPGGPLDRFPTSLSILFCLFPNLFSIPRFFFVLLVRPARDISFPFSASPSILTPSCSTATLPSNVAPFFFFVLHSRHPSALLTFSLVLSRS